MYLQGLSNFFIVLLVFATSSVAFDYDSCRSTLSNTTLTEGLVDIGGRPSNNRSDARGYRYSQCLLVCGGGVDTNEPKVVLETMAAWFLPYLVLLSQIPLQTASTIENIDVL